MPPYSKAPVYLFYGNQVDAVLRARDQVLDAVLPAELRAENLTEYFPSGAGDTVRFGELLDEIAGDMAMLSFIPEAPKCVVVTNPAELFSGAARGRARKTDKPDSAERALEHAVRWIERDLPQTGHTLMFIALEDEAAAREVNERSPLFQAISHNGVARRFSEKKAFFRIEEAILSRNANDLIQATRDLWKPGKGDQAVYGGVVRTLRYLIQANVARERKLADTPAELALLFPDEAQRNLFKANPSVTRKYLGRAVYRTAHLLEAYQGMLDVYRALRPRPDDLYVADAQGLMEQVLVRLLNSPRPAR
ncbi:MAG: hypothetical protein BWZ08_02340 [candidate division BRC1 bacterium ADurb.BinA292]|nr:MAG: hypothetical protein BWZ08_02340 [candidate division BRC1 bacterium ADurb.BinA292]HOR28876.1 hypothetical protein [Candidatus Sumerlaeota bacterium]